MDWTIDIDLDRPGKQVGRVVFGIPGTDPATAIAGAPIACIANGLGPTLVMTAGVHGDEYEGQVALSELAADLQPGEVKGRVIIMPAVNVAACSAGQRFSPVDGLNLNRLFRPDAADGYTRRIARFVETELFGRADYAVDLHCGGIILDFLPATVVAVTESAGDDGKRLRLAAAFGAETCLLFGERTMGVAVAIESAMMRQGVIGISAELGGAGGIKAETLAICRSGVRRVLAATGIVAPSRPPAPVAPRLIDLRDDRVYVLAGDAGVLEPLVALGDAVLAGELLGLLHHPEAIEAPPTKVRSAIDGLVVAKRALARSSPGDWLFIVGVPIETPTG